MKKNRLLYYLWCLIAIGLLLPDAVNAQELIPDWDGNDIIDTNSEGNKWGWAASTGGTDWQEANAGTGVRFRDLTSIAIDTGGTFTGREFMYRWEGSYVGSTLSLGLPDDPGNTTVQNGIPLTGGTAYSYDGLFLWVNNGGNPTYEFAISDAPSGGNVLVSKSYSISTKNRYYPVNLLFKPTTTGDYYLQVTQTGGLVGGGAGGLMGLAGSTMQEYTSSDATLSDIALSEGSLDPVFDSAVVSYNVALPYGTTSVDVTATPTIELSEVVGDSTIDVSSLSGATDIVVTSEDGSTEKTYAVNFSVDPGDTITTLLSLASSIGTLSPEFDPEVLSYQVELASSVTSVDLSATTTVPGATTVGDGTIDVSSSVVIDVVVTSDDESGTRTYEINFNKLAESTDATLSDISFDFGYLKGVFDSGTTTYEVLVPAGASTVNVTASKSHEFATIDSGDGAIDVSGGNTSTVINVTAEDGTTTAAYTVNFTVDAANYMFGWDGDGHTGTGSEPNSFGWENTAGDAPWEEANVTAGSRYRDDPGGYTYEDGGATVTGRQFLLRYDGSTASETSAFTYPVVLEANSAYEFSFDYVYGGSGTAPATLTAGIGTSNDVTSDVASKGFETASNTTQYRSGSLVFKTDAAGVYYVKFTCSEKSWQGVNNLSLEEFTSSDATLSDLTVNDGDLDPAFDSGTTTYNLLVAPDLDTLFITATPTIEFSTVTGADTVLIEAESGVATVTVTAMDESGSQDYTINWEVGIDSTDATLSAIDLSVDGLSLDPAFSPDLQTYAVDVPLSVNSVDLTATTTVSEATKVGDSTINVSDSVSIDIVVTSANGSVDQTYTINFNKQPASEDATLSDISFDFGYLKGVFDSGTTTYEVLVPAGASTVNVTATKNDTTATINSGDGGIDVSGGNTSTVINVTAEDGSTTAAYTVNFTVDTDNYMFGWDGDGITDAGSEPDNFGWQCTVISGWNEANAGGGVRYTDQTYTYDGGSQTGRVLFTRWDGSGGTNTSSIWAYPATLQPGFYQFTAKMALHANTSTAEYYHQINSAVDNTGDTLAINTLSVPNTGELFDMQLAFEVTSAGTYYFTLGSNNGNLGAITDLSLEEVSTNATLSDLTVDAGTLDPAFDPDSTTYSLLLPPGTDELIISATSTSALATVEGDGTIALAGTTGAETLTVTAADGTTTKDYVINWEVETVSSDATLSDLSIDGGLSLSPTFSAGTTSYTVDYDYTTDSTYITAVENYPAATVAGDTGTFVLSDGAVATITVTAENSSTQDYTITFNKDSNLVPLWDGNDVTGTDSEANKWGWASSTGGTDWQEANQLGVRFRDVSNVAIDTGSTFTGREFLYRWEGSYIGSTLSLGLPDDPGNTTVQNGIPLTGGKYYSFEGLFEWINNANSPTYVFAIADSASGGNIVASETYSISVKERYYPMDVLIEAPATGNYYLQVTQTGGLSGDQGGLMGLAGLTLQEFTSSDATLSDIALSSGSLNPAFDSATVSYDVELPYGTTSVDVTATPTISVSEVVGDGAIDVSSGSGSTDIEVTAIDGVTTKTYAVNFSVDPGDTVATLSAIDLSVSSLSLSPEFDPDSLTYTVDVPASVNSVDVMATTTVGSATSVGDGTINVSDSTSTDIVVTATNGTDTRTYTINFNKQPASADATLSGISFDSGYLKGAFDSGTTTYEVLVPAGVSTVNVTAIATHDYATVTSGDGAIDVTGASPSTVINITAEDGTTTAAYTLNFTGDASNYMFGWDGDGVTGAGSEPDNFGWQCTGIDDTGWTEANVLGVRFQDGVTYSTNRVLYVRWDGTGGTSTSSIYGYPITLDAGYYLFTAKIGWNSVASAPDYFYQINSAADNTGDTLTSDVISVPSEGVLHDLQLGFQVETAGTYYFTLGSSNGNLGAITDLLLETTDETDGDGIPDAVDNCPTTANADQADLDGDEIGDACDDDIDGDGVLNEDDAFPMDETEDTDTDGDGIGNNEDTDDDGDGTPDEDDAFPLDETEDTDTDGDGIGNNADTDGDGDGQSDAHETTCGSDPLDAESTSTDSDSDGVPDCVANEDDDGDGITNGEDNCPGTANEDQADMDGDGIGDVCDDDRDGDGTLNDADAFPDDSAEDTDTDGDGIGNNADTDDDGDGQSDEDEIACGSDPLDAASTSQDTDNDGMPDCIEILDDDGDGVANGDDNCPDTPNPDQADQDGDGIGDVCDEDFVVLNLNDSDKVLKVGPNPVREALTVDWSAYEVTHPTIKIFSLDGKLKWQGVDLQGSQVEVDMSRFSNGVFMMYIYTNDKPIMLKVIKE